MTKKTITPEASQRAKRSRRKGHDFERRVVLDVKEVLPGHAETITRGYWQARRNAGAAVVPDVVMPQFWVECKAGKGRNLREALAQAIDDAQTSGSAKIPVAVVCDDGKGATVVLRYADWLRLLPRLCAPQLGPRDVPTGERLG